MTSTFVFGTAPKIFTFITALFAAPDYIAKPVLTVQKTACGITLIADKHTPEFAFIRKKDLCAVVASLKRVTRSPIGKVWVYLTPFTWSKVQGFPALAEVWRDRKLTDWNMFQFAGMTHSAALLQIDPLEFNKGRVRMWTEVSAPSNDLVRWSGLTTVAHEVLHSVLATQRVPRALQHCAMVYNAELLPRAAANLSRTYGIDAYYPWKLRVYMQNSYREQCGDFLALIKRLQ